VWTHEGSRIGSDDRQYRRLAAQTAPVAALEEINGKLIIGGPLAPFGRLKSAPQVVPNSRNRVVPSSGNQVVFNRGNWVVPNRGNRASRTRLHSTFINHVLF
jgi:hypothetical protein